VTLELISSRYHPDDLPLFYQWVARASREAQDLEAEPRLRMGDGSIKYVHTLAHATRNERGELEYIGAVQDVTERRRSEDALNKVRSELAHVARVTTLGALTASIAHEVNQPLSGIVTNASTSLRMLADDPPNIEGARETARRTIRDANRASEVIARLRALFGKKALVMERVDLNEAIREVVARRERVSAGSRCHSIRARHRSPIDARRPGATATGGPQPDAQRARCHARHERRAAVCRDQDGMR
jgi:C4-dicarboxylate-specific signal transduction histidine kinase